MITVPKRYSYVEVYTTFRCNFSCSYCINGFGGIKRNRKELTAREWIMALNNIDTNGLPITFGGGEPTQHREFYDIINGLKPRTKIDILSNGTFNVKEFMLKIPKTRFHARGYGYKPIRFSYHPKSTNPDSLIETCSALQSNGYPCGIFGLNHPDNLQKNIAMAEKCRSARTFFFVRDFLGWHENQLYGNFKYPHGLNGNLKNCECKTSELLIDPEGSVYRCHRDLYSLLNPIGNILRMGFEIEDRFMPCSNFGACNPCDLKRKASPDLSHNRCAVTIEEDKN